MIKTGFTRLLKATYTGLINFLDPDYMEELEKRLDELCEARDALLLRVDELTSATNKFISEERPDWESRLNKTRQDFVKMSHELNNALNTNDRLEECVSELEEERRHLYQDLELEKARRRTAENDRDVFMNRLIEAEQKYNALLEYLGDNIHIIHKYNPPALPNPPFIFTCETDKDEE